MSKLNPFDPNGTVKSNLFAGRAKQVNQVCSRLSQLQHGMPASFFLYGERGIGKTALAKIIRYVSTLNVNELHKLNLLTSYYAVENGQSFSSVLQESLNKLTENMERGLLENLSGRLGKLMSNGKFAIGAFGGSMSFEGTGEGKKEKDREKEILVKDQAVSILSNIVKGLAENPTNEKQGILIIIDEFHNLKSISSSASILRNIVTSLDFEDLGKVAFMIIGYEEDMDKFFVEDSSSKRIFDFYKLDVMPNDEAAEILTKGFTQAGLKWDDEALKMNIKVAGGYPHSVQVIGHILVENDNDGFIDRDDWTKAIFETADVLSSKSFSTMYSYKKQLTELDKILVELANTNKPMSKIELASVIPCKNIYQQVGRLRTKGAVKENSDGTVFLQSQLLRVSILVDQAGREITKSSPSPSPAP